MCIRDRYAGTKTPGAAPTDCRRPPVFDAYAGRLKPFQSLSSDLIHAKNRLLGWIRGYDQVIARPGRGGHMPPRSSMARATSASGERNPKAMRVRSHSLVFTLSTRAFDLTVDCTS